MPIDWRETVLRDVVALKRGHDLPTPTRRPGRVPVVGSFGITGWHDEAKAPAPGVTIGRSGASIGTAAYVNEPFWPLNTCLYVTDFRGNDPRWIYRLLDLIDFSAYNSGSAQPSLNRNFLAQIPVSVPEITEQRRVASVLGALDDLVETNLTAIANLRSISLAALDAVSRDGDVVPFGQIATQIRDGASSEGLAAGTPYLGLEHFGADGVGLIGVGDASTVDSNKARFRSGDVLYGKLRPYFRKVDRPGFDGVCSTEIWVLRPRAGWGAATLSAVVARPHFTDFAMAGNTGTRMPRANWAHIATMPVPVPPRPQRDVIDQILDELWHAGVELSEEAAVLTRTRKELLPLLMSGRVRVTDLEAV